MARLNNTQVSAVLNWGPGYNNGPDQYAYPTYYHNRGIKIYNTTGKDLFLPDNSTGEKNAVFNYVPGTVYRGNWVDSQGCLRRDQIAFGNYCWNGVPGGSDPRPTPPACPSGYTDGGVYATYGPMVYPYPPGYVETYVGTVLDGSADVSTITQYDVRIAGASRDAIYFCQNIAQGYFNVCSTSYPYKWIVVRACYKS
jgi:hypothetical protein